MGWLRLDNPREWFEAIGKGGIVRAMHGHRCMVTQSMVQAMRLNWGKRMRMTVACMLLTAVVALPGAAARAQETPAAKRPLPSMELELNSLTYPTAAQRIGMPGRVLMAFTVTKKGRADNIEMVSSQPTGVFETVATKAIKQMKFTVPADWEATQGPEHRYLISVLFKINPCVAPGCVVPKAHEEADDFVIVGAQAK